MQLHCGTLLQKLYDIVIEQLYNLSVGLSMLLLTAEMPEGLTDVNCR